MTTRRWLLGIVASTVRRPVTTLAIALAVAALSALSLSRARIDSTLSGMLGGGSPSVEALSRIVAEFRAAEDLLILASVPDNRPENEARRDLLEYADRFERLVAGSDRARGMITAVRYRPDLAAQDFIAQTVLPAGALYLDDTSFEALLRRLDPAEVRAQLAQDEAMLAAPGPGAGSLARQLLKDPLRLREFVQEELGGVLAGSPSDGNFSDDGRALLIRVSGARPVNDIEFSKHLTALASDLAGKANTGGLDVGASGGYAIAAASATMIRADAISNTISSFVVIHIFFALCYRRFILTPLVIVLAAGIGMLAAFGLYALVHPSLTPLSAFVATMLAGLGVDYAIHFRSHHEHLTAAGLSSAEASVRTARDLAGPLSAACITTIFGFGTVALGDVRMLKDFAILGCLGLAGSLIAVLLTLPAMLQLLPRARAGSARLGLLGRFIAGIDDHPRLAIAWALAMLAAAAASIATTPGFVPPFETDTSVMHPHPNPPLEVERTINERFAGEGDRLLVLVDAGGGAPDELVARSHAVADALSAQAARDAGIRSTLGLATLLPDPRLAPARLARLEKLDPTAILAGVRRAFEESSFDPAAFDTYLAFLHRLLTNRAVPGIGDVLKAPELAARLLPSASVGPGAPPPTSALVVVNTASFTPARAALIERTRALLARAPGATLTGVVVVGHDLEHAARRDLARFSILSVALVLTWLFVQLRRPLDVLLALSPVVFAMVCVFGGMCAAGERFNPVNIVAVPLLAGIAVDSGIFLVAITRRAQAEGRSLRLELQPTVHAILCTTGSTVLGFGTLFWTRIPAVRSLGLVTLVGEAASLVGCLLFLLPILLCYAPRARKNEA